MRKRKRKTKNEKLEKTQKRLLTESEKGGNIDKLSQVRRPSQTKRQTVRHGSEREIL